MLVHEPFSRELGVIYRDLSECLEHVERSARQTGDLSQRICCTVLEDDLRALVEECEDYLVSTVVARQDSVDAFESRSMTVLEEVRELFRDGGRVLIP